MVFSKPYAAVTRFDSAERCQGVSRRVWRAAALLEHPSWPLQHHLLSASWARPGPCSSCTSTKPKLWVILTSQPTPVPPAQPWGYSREEDIAGLRGFFCSVTVWALTINRYSVPATGIEIYGDFSVQSQLYRSKNNQAWVLVPSYFTRFRLYLMTKKYRC